MTVEDVLSAEGFVEGVLQSDAPVVVDFYADWCAPCRMVSPVIEALSEKWQDTVRFVKLDVDRVPEVSQALGISSIPTVALFDHGEVRAFSIGAKSGPAFELELGLGTGVEAAVGGDQPDDEVEVGTPPVREARGLLAAIGAWWRGS